MTRSHRIPSTPSDLRHAVLGVRTAIQAAAFWIGVLLPLVLVAILLLGDRGRIVDLDVVVRLVAISVVACLVGHGHDPGGPG